MHIDAQVTDRTGRVVTDLTQTEFEVLDNGARQKITSFERSSAPLDLLLLLDASGSMRPVIRAVAAEARAAVEQLHKGDRASAMLFAANVRIVQELTEDTGRIGGAIGGGATDPSLGGGTNTNAAILDGAKYLSSQAERGRRAILIITDNSGLNVRVPDERVIRTLLDNDTVLHGIIVGKNQRLPAVRPGSYVNPDYTEVDVPKIARATGGETVQPNRVSEALTSMIERIRQRYSMTYAAPGMDTRGYHRIDVRIPSRPELIVKARQGYYAE